MEAYYIGVHVKAEDAKAVSRETVELFAREGFIMLGESTMASVLEDEGALPDEEDWYGVVISGVSRSGWVSVYVADWPDSGLLARVLSGKLHAPVLELWVADSRHWGYTYFQEGEVQDRFADAPQAVADSPEEANLYLGQADRLAPILQVPVAEAGAALAYARAQAGRLAAGSVEQFTQTVGLPFAHAYTGYESFFEDESDDYTEEFENWSRFRHFAFRTPSGREALT